MSVSFAALKESERIQNVKSILYALCSRKNTTNDLFDITEDIAEARKKKRRTEVSTGRSCCRYALKGKKLCQAMFAAIVQMHPRTISSYATQVAEEMEITLHTIHEGDRRSGKMSSQSTVVMAFLTQYAQLNAMACPTGRGSESETPIQSLSSHTRRKGVYEDYEKNWREIMNAFLNITNSNPGGPSSPVTMNAFLKVWHNHFPTLKIMKQGSDLCDTCTSLGNNAASNISIETRRVVEQSMNRHRDEASKELKHYVLTLQKSIQNRNQMIHVTFDFSEKCLLPRFVRQPGQLHFVTGLKIDMFGILMSSSKKNYIFGLTEGFWPNLKTANEVGSMLCYTIKVEKGKNRDLVLHADNCSEQNKNRYMLWHLAWRVICGLEREVVLNFLVAGHTKNRCDAAFGLVKRSFKQQDVLDPKSMIALIDRSSHSNTSVCATDLEWVDGKSFLSKYFVVPSGLHLSKYHVFKFNKNFPGKVMAKSFSFSDHFESFNLLRKGTSHDEVRKLSESGIVRKFKVVVPPLEKTASIQEGNRKAYLQKHVLDRYYNGNEDVKCRFFGSGCT